MPNFVMHALHFGTSFFYHVRFPWIPLERDVKLSRAKSGMRANKALDTGEHACALPILDVSEAR